MTDDTENLIVTVIDGAEEIVDPLDGLAERIAADPGEAAPREAALRWKREGRSVRIARPPRGCDVNDLLLGRAPRIGEGAA